MDDKILVNVIKDNKKLIYSIIHKYGDNTNFDDLYQVSVIGIMKAYNNYDSSRDVKFSTYAYKYILSEVLQYINDSKLIKTSREYRKLGRKILDAKNVLSQKLMKEPSNYEISLFLDIDEQIINDIMKYQMSVRSLDEVVSYDGKEITLIDQVMAKKRVSVDDRLMLKEVIQTLPKEEKELIQMRYFLEKTQSEIAKYFGTNQVQVSRNEQKVLKKIKNNLCGVQ